jgi:ABC-type dipeptide/oligopeptide/nickel transport system permease subunit
VTATLPNPAADPLALVELPPAARLHGWRRTWFRFRQRKSALIALAFVVLMLLAAVFAPLLAPFDPADQHLGDRFAGFSGTYLLGTDDLGRDQLSRLLFGLRTSLIAAAVAVAIALVVGLVVGTLAGYRGGRVDALFMRLIDGILAIPGLLLIMAIIGALGAGLRSVIVGLSIAFFPTFARLCRGQVLSVKEEQYVEAARVMGARDLRIVVRHVVPNALSPVIVQALMTMGFALLAEGSLSFLGLSVQPPGTSLGTMLERGFDYKERSQLLILMPGIAITLLSWAFNVVADGLRDAVGRTEVGG